MAEFQKLSEVEKLETASDNASVLVEEGGEIKRVPKKEVGGAGGYVATLTINDLEDPSVAWDGEFVLSENYDELYEVLCAGGNAWIDYTVLMQSVPGPSLTGPESVYPTNYDKMRMAIINWMISDIGLIAYCWFPLANNVVPALFPNGSHNLPPRENGDEK
jgi:hypothetical protein